MKHKSPAKECLHKIKNLGSPDKIKSAAPVSYPANTAAHSVTWSAPGLPTVTFTNSSLEELYTASSWAYTAISKNSESIAELPPVVQEKVDGVWKETDKYPELTSFIDDPFGPDENYPFWGWEGYMNMLGIHRYVVGSAYLKPIIVDGKLYATIPLFEPNLVKPKDIDSRGVAQSYEYKSTIYKKDELIDISAAKISGYDSAVSPLQAAMGDIITNRYSETRIQSGLKNTFAPGMIISSERDLNAKEADRVVDDMVDNYVQATAEGKPWFVSTPTQILNPPTARSMVYVDTMSWSRSSIFAVLGLPPVIAGILNGANYNNLEQSVKLHWTERLFPIAKSIYSQLNAKLIRRLYGPDVRIWFDDSETEIGIIKMNSRIKQAQEMQKMGFSANSVNVKFNLGMDFDPALDLVNKTVLDAGHADDLLIDGKTLKSILKRVKWK